MTDRFKADEELTGENAALYQRSREVGQADSEHRQGEDKLRQMREELAISQELLAANQVKLAEAEQMLQLVIDTIPVRIFWKDVNLTYRGCNQLFAQDAGRQLPADLIGKSDYDMGWKEQADLYRQDDQAVIASGMPKINYEEPQTSPEGDHVWLRTSKVPLCDVDGSIIGILGTY
ncbi:MAG: PAS domain-containing protein, partial [Syntrophales bacterium LBB04]|nr:PAS domain-containing protein [Syntrophales bacterium LBB04]